MRRPELIANRSAVHDHPLGLREKVQANSKQALYASTLLFVLTTVLVKLSIIFFLRALTPITIVKRTSDALGVVVSVWGLGSFLAAAFPCSIPDVWQFTSDSCVNRVSARQLKCVKGVF